MYTLSKATYYKHHADLIYNFLHNKKCVCEVTHKQE